MMQSANNMNTGNSMNAENSMNSDSNMNMGNGMNSGSNMNMGNGMNSGNNMNMRKPMAPGSGMRRERMNQQQMLEWVMMLTLCAIDMNLYLDTHPDDSDALDYLNQCSELLKSARRTYEASYGSFTVAGGTPFETFTWVETPMPWEGGGR